MGRLWGGSISNSYATGDISSASSSGGLVGQMNNGGSISNSYATGAVSASSSSFSNSGGWWGLCMVVVYGERIIM